MKGKVSYKKIYSGFFVLLTVWIGTQLLAPLMAPNLEMPAYLLGGVISVGIFFCFLLTQGVQRLIPAVSFAAVLIAWIILFGWNEFIYLITEYGNWLRGYEAQTGYGLSYEMINICLMGIVFILFSLVAERIFVLKALTGIALTGYMLFTMVTGKQLHKVTVCLILLYVFSCVTEYLQKRETAIKIIVYLLPFLLAFSMALMFMPESDKPYEWRFVKKIYQSAEDLVVILMQKAEELFSGDREGFGMIVTGFSGDGEIGDGRSEQDGNMLQISLKSGKAMNMYLTGNVFDTFNGDNWEMTGENTEYDHVLDLLETLYAVRRHDPEKTLNYMNQGRIGITYTNMRTEYLFTPLKVRDVATLEKWKEGLREQGGEWRFQKKQGHGTEYDAVFYQLNMGQDYFASMIEQENNYVYGGNPGEDTLDELTFMFKDLPAEILTEESLRKRSEAIRSQYAGPIGASEEVGQFIDDITKDCRTDYERCKAIETVLSGNTDIAFTYTVRPGKMPDHKRFPDYFLLEGREGYCTYFATAFVIMVRELGIPARYVQGFCVPGSELGEEAIDVTANMAHAWPEVYFEGVGWIPFEPTPGYGSGRYHSWTPYVDPHQGMALPAMPEERPIPEPLPDIPASTEKGTQGFILLIMAGVAILTLIMMAGVMAAIEYYIRKRAYGRYTPEEKMRENVGQNLAILRYIGFQLGQGETIGEFRQRILGVDSGYSLNFIIHYEKVSYGNGWVSDEMIRSVLQEKDLILKKLKDGGKWKYYWIMFKLLWQKESGTKKE